MMRQGRGWNARFILILPLLAHEAWAAEVGLTTEAHSFAGNDVSYLTWFVFVVAVWFVVVLANTFASSPPDHVIGFIASIGEGPVAHHLYFPCRLGGRPGHIRTMSQHKAEVLVEAGLRKGDWVDLEIETFIVKSKVLRVSRVQRNGDHLVLLRLKPGSADQRAALKGLLTEWTGIGDFAAGEAAERARSERPQRPIREANPVSSHR